MNQMEQLIEYEDEGEGEAQFERRNSLNEINEKKSKKGQSKKDPQQKVFDALQKRHIGNQQKGKIVKKTRVVSNTKSSFDINQLNLNA